MDHSTNFRKMVGITQLPMCMEVQVQQQIMLSLFMLESQL